mgnify:CR=1 FL=1
MREIKKRFSVNLHPVKLYLDDVTHIINKLSETMAIELQYQNIAYDSIDEFKNNITKESINCLKIEAKSLTAEHSSIVIDIKFDKVHIYASSKAENLASYITEFLRKKVKWYSWSSNSPWWYFIDMLLSILMMSLFIITLYLKEDIPTNRILPGLLPLSLLYIYLRDKITLKNSQIILHKKMSRPSYLENKKYDLLTGLIIAVFAFILGKIL